MTTKKHHTNPISAALFNFSENNNTQFKAKFLTSSQQISSLSLGTSPTVSIFGAVYSSDSLGWHCEHAENPPKADSCYTYKHLIELRNHMPSQVGGKISHSFWSPGEAREWWAEGAITLVGENERDQPSTLAETQQRSLAIFRSLISAPKC